MDETPAGIHKLAEWDNTQWLGFINDVSTQAGKLCVPAAIIGDNMPASESKQLYADKMQSLVQDTYPLTTLKVVLNDSQDGPGLIADNALRAEAVAFIDNNPDFDLRNNSVYDILDTNTSIDLTGVTDVNALQEALAPIQRLIRTFSGSPRAVAAMIPAGITSASAITAIPLSSFVATYGALLGGTAAATSVHAKAGTISTIATSSYVSTYSSIVAPVDGGGGGGSYTMHPGFPPPVTPTYVSATLTSMFGNMNYCACEQCTSVYSPAAYYTDILRFLSTRNPILYTEMLRRRPDLPEIDLTCRNTNTPIPYIDLVIELLEGIILKKFPQPFFNVPFFQTRGTADELAAEPEHVYKTFATIGGVYTWQYVDYEDYKRVYNPHSITYPLPAFSAPPGSSNLTSAVYPFNLPFSLPAEEARTYLKYMGKGRYDMMRLFQPFSTFGVLSDFNIYCEMLGLTQAQGEIVTNTYSSSSSTWLFYGFTAATVSGFIDPADPSLTVAAKPWQNMLTQDRLDILIQQLKMQYKEFLQFLTTDFLNSKNPSTGARTITVSTALSAPSYIAPDSCNIRYLELVTPTAAVRNTFLIKLHRFVRLWRSNNIEIRDWDLLFRSLRMTDIDPTYFAFIGRILQLTEKIGIKVSELAGWWGYMDLHQYVDYGGDPTYKYPSVYDLAYRNLAVINRPIDAFKDLGDLDPMSISSSLLPAAYTGYTAQIAAANKIKEEELLAIMNYMGSTVVTLGSAVTLEVLSPIYTISFLSKKLGLTIEELLEILYDLNIDIARPVFYTVGGGSITTAISARLDQLDELLAAVEVLKSGKLSLTEVVYLTRVESPVGPIAPSPIKIQAFYEKLRVEIQKFPEYTWPPMPTAEDTEALNKLKNIINQALSKEFDVQGEIMQAILAKTILLIDPGRVPLHVKLLDIDFFSSTDPVQETQLTDATHVLFNQIYVIYRYIYKCSYIVNKLKLNTFEATYFINTIVVGFDFAVLNNDFPTLAHSRAQFKGLLQMIRWIDVRDQLSLIEQQLVRLIITSAAIVTGPALVKNFTEWQSIINRSAWGTMLKELIGDPALVTSGVAAGLMHVTFPTDFSPSNRKSIEKIWRILSICTTCLRSGLKPATLLATLQQTITMNDSHQVLLAAKGKHTEEEWAEIARPLRDTLRKKQRDALLGYVINHPDVSIPGDLKKWSNENDVYAFLLIDPEMDPCMLTSRLKQGISSVQLFVHRVLLGLESTNYNILPRITMSVPDAYQWDQWRARYSIWGSNRMVFLYPENWIEPELRDNKSVFYEEMESVLAQGDITTKRAEDALLTYLRKLQSVARLEPIGSCDTPDANNPSKIITYAFARTYEEPHKYYYRTLKDFSWGPWEPIEIDIKSNHVISIVHRDRLYLFWLSFREKNVKGRASTSAPISPWFYNDTKRPNTETSLNEPAPGSAGAPVYVKQIEVTLNWSECKDGQWQEQKVSKDKMYVDLNPKVLTDFPKIFDGSLSGISSVDQQKYMFLSNGRQLSITDFVISRMQFSAESYTDGELYLWLNHPYKMSFGGNDDVGTVFTTIFKGGEPEVLRTVFNNFSVKAPTGTVFTNNKMALFPLNYDYPASLTPVVQELKINDINVTGPVSLYVYPLEQSLGVAERVVAGTATVLRNSPNGSFKLTNLSNTYRSILEKGFFYEDKKNTFYARVVDEASFPSSALSVSIKSTTVDAAMYYQVGAWRGTSYGSSISIAGTGRTFRFFFQSFFHPQVESFIAKLNTKGIGSLLDISTQSVGDSLNFSGTYLPAPIVLSGRYPTNKVDFDFAGAYSVYNWELFFHVPLLIAKRLSDNQKFDEAREWFHYIFDPTSNVDATGTVSVTKERFWKCKPLYDEASLPIATLDDLMVQIHNNIASAKDQVTLWEENPFKPHVIARVRLAAYQKSVVMSYLDNLIAWADKLYRQNTIETINEATNLYIMAANILGPRPMEVPKRADTGPRTFNELAAAGLDVFSNAVVSLENFIDPNSAPLSLKSKGGLSTVKLFYFCLPNNPKWLSYYDTVSNRLFNIRHCRNIDGQIQQLPLFEPPIDPALLVRAAAAGMDASSVLDSLASPPMPYKFSMLVQKANELCGDVKALGSSLIAALEKKDAEALAVLRSGQEATVLESMKRVKQAQIEEAKAAITAAAGMKEAIQVRYNYYSTRQYKSGRESQHLTLLDQSQKHQTSASTMAAIASVVSVIPEINFQVPFALGPSFGGRELSAVFNALSTIQAQKAAQKSAEATKTITEAGYERRMDDWRFQADSASKELAQVDKQVIAAQMRKAVAEKELETQLIQISNAKEIDDFMRSKYTNVELYSWMITQISTTYFQSYQLAYDMAKRAEKALKYELPLLVAPGGQFIKFGYWDSLKKGLYSGEHLQYDIRKMELAYLEGNKRELELTKHFSLALNDAEQLLQFRETGSCTIKCDENLFNLDFPAHYMRRIKSVSISIPCVAGPYTTIAALLTQTNARNEDEMGVVSSTTASASRIATSSAQNDSGMFELSFKDERFLPFEGSPAICDWNLSLMMEPLLRQFDYNTISDVILHVKYTAQHSSSKQSTVELALKKNINNLSGATAPINIDCFFSMKHHFSNAWFAYSNAFATDPTAKMEIDLNSGLFPYLCQGKKIELLTFQLIGRFKAPVPGGTGYDIGLVKPGGTSTSIINTASPYNAVFGSIGETVMPTGDVPFKFNLTKTVTLTNPADFNAVFDDIYLVVTYKLVWPV